MRTGVKEFSPDESAHHMAALGIPRCEEGYKDYEFRLWPAPRSLVSQRIVVHAAKRAVNKSK